MFSPRMKSGYAATANPVAVRILDEARGHLFRVTPRSESPAWVRLRCSFAWRGPRPRGTENRRVTMSRRATAGGAEFARAAAAERGDAARILRSDPRASDGIRA